MKPSSLLIAASVTFGLTFAAPDLRKEMSGANTVKKAEAFIKKYGLAKKTDSGWTLLHFAAADGNNELVKYLAGKGSDVNARNEDQETPLYLAAGRADAATAETMKALIEAGADINYVRKRDSTTVEKSIVGRLIISSAYDKPDLAPILRYFKTKGWDPNLQNAHGQNILFCCWEQSWIAQFENTLPTLLELGANPNHRDARGVTPIMEAVYGQYGQAKSMEILAQAGADVNNRDDIGFTALHRAAGSFNAAMFAKLIELGANVNAQDNEGRPPLAIFIAAGNSAGIQLILQKGADVDLRDKSGKSMIDYAITVKANRAKTLPFLLPRSKQINSVDARGDTPLIRAVMLDQLDVVKLLVENGADLNARNKYDATPLKIAEMNHHKAIAAYLAAKGAR